MWLPFPIGTCVDGEERFRSSRLLVTGPLHAQIYPQRSFAFYIGLIVPRDSLFQAHIVPLTGRKFQGSMCKCAGLRRSQVPSTRTQATIRAIQNVTLAVQPSCPSSLPATRCVCPPSISCVASFCVKSSVLSSFVLSQ